MDKAIREIPFKLPGFIIDLIKDADIYDRSSSKDARVYLIDKDDGYYLKISLKDSLKREYVMTEYFYHKGLGTEVLYYEEKENDILLTKALKGKDCTDSLYLSDPKRLCDVLATGLRMLHELDHSDCPIKRTPEYIALAKHNLDKMISDGKRYHNDLDLSKAQDMIAYSEKVLKCDVLIHGDHCLPNIILDDWKLSGYIDVDYSGIGDRHIDIYWTLRSLAYNLKTDKYHDYFLDVYGRDKIDVSILDIIKVIEYFG